MNYQTVVVLRVAKSKSSLSLAAVVISAYYKYVIFVRFSARNHCFL